MATCIFCGKKPESKNKEHVLPDWLIRLTGNEGKEGNFGFDLGTNPPKLRRYTFDKFTFPACTSCNTKFKTLEDEASRVIKKMISADGLSEWEINILFDWLDKVRIGLLLGFNILDSKYIHVYPSFYIEKGIGLFDRMLMINRTSDFKNILSARGVDSLAFRMKPSCFLLVIIIYFYLTILLPTFFRED